MKIHGVMIEDKEKGVFFAFVRQFPGVCAQGDSARQAHEKVNKYFKAYIDRIKDKEVEMDEEQILSM